MTNRDSYQDQSSWFFGNLTRQDAKNVLKAERQDGVFLIRKSDKHPKDYILSVREDGDVGNYIIKIDNSTPEKIYSIGSTSFKSIPELIRYYTCNYLKSTPLVKLANHPKYIGQCDFAGTDSNELPFKKGEILVALEKHDNDWYTARNSLGHTGLIPSNHIIKYHEDTYRTRVLSNYKSSSLLDISSKNSSLCSDQGDNIYGTIEDTKRASTASLDTQFHNMKLPCRARVIRAKTPNAYNTKALPLKVGDTVIVRVIHEDGQCEGSMNGRDGFFPFTHIQIIQDKSRNFDSLDFA